MLKTKPARARPAKNSSVKVSSDIECPNRPDQCNRNPGQVLAEGDNRSKVFLATKFGNEYDPATRKMTGAVRGDANYIRQAIDLTIKRLGTTPDLYYQHRVDPDVQVSNFFRL